MYQTDQKLPAETSKSETLYLMLRDDILAGTFEPGARLSESSLSRHYGMSRTPIRDAVARLEQDGLVERYGMMARIRERSPEEVIDIYRVRVMLERAIAVDAAQRRRDIDVLHLDAALATEEAVDRNDPDAVKDANWRLHGVLGNASHNEPLRDLQRRLTLQVAAIPGTTLTEPGRWEQAHEEHAQIIAAVRDRDAETAGAIAEQHMNAACQLRLSMLADRSPTA